MDWKNQFPFIPVIHAAARKPGTPVERASASAVLQGEITRTPTAYCSLLALAARQSDMQQSSAVSWVAWRIGAVIGEKSVDICETNMAFSLTLPLPEPVLCDMAHGCPYAGKSHLNVIELSL